MVRNSGSGKTLAADVRTRSFTAEIAESAEKRIHPLPGVILSGLQATKDLACSGQEFWLWQDTRRRAREVLHRDESRFRMNQGKGQSISPPISACSAVKGV